MPAIPQAYRQQKLSATAGNVPLSQSDIVSMGSTYREMGAAGKSLTEFGQVFLQKTQRAEANDQINTFQADTQAELNAHMQTMNPNTDPEAFRKGADEIIQRRTQMAGTLSNPDAREYSGQWMKDFGNQEQNKIFWQSKELQVNQIRDNTKLNIQKFADLAMNAPDERTYQQALAGMKATTDRAGGAGEDDGFSVMTKDEADLMYNTTVAQVEKSRKTLIADRATQNLTSYVFGTAQTKGYDFTEQMMADPEFTQYMTNSGIPIEDQDRVLNSMQKRLTIQREKQMESDREEMGKLLDNNDLSPTIIDNSSLTEKEKLIYKDLRVKMATNDNTVTNPQVYNTLRNRASDVHLGGQTRSKYLQELQIAKADKQISQKDYEELRDFSGKEFQAHKVNQIKDMEQSAKNELVDHMGSTMDLYIQAKEMPGDSGANLKLLLYKNKVQIWNYNRFSKIFGEWMVANPDADDSAVFMKAQIIKSGLNKPYEEVQKEYSIEQKRLKKTGEPEAPGKFTGWNDNEKMLMLMEKGYSKKQIEEYIGSK